MWSHGKKRRVVDDKEMEDEDRRLLTTRLEEKTNEFQ